MRNFGAELHVKPLDSWPPMQTWNVPGIATPEGTVSPVVLFSDEDARAVVIGFKPGQELGDHQVKEHAWVFVVEGSVRIRSQGEDIDAPAGTLARFEPDERHSVSSEGGAKILLLLAPWPGPGHYRGQEKARGAAV